MESERGATETVGTILMLALVVTTISIVGGAVFAVQDTSSAPLARFDATPYEGDLVLEHLGGDPLRADSFDVILRENGTRIPGTAGTAFSDAGGDGRFEPGERWRFNVTESVARGETVAVVYTGGSPALIDETVVDVDPTDPRPDAHSGAEGGGGGDDVGVDEKPPDDPGNGNTPSDGDEEGDESGFPWDIEWDEWWPPWDSDEGQERDPWWFIFTG